MSVYLLQCQASGLVKIGFSSSPIERLPSIATMSPTRLKLLALFIGGQPLEAKLHSEFRGKREHGEWFRLSDADLRRLRKRQDIKPDVEHWLAQRALDRSTRPGAIATEAEEPGPVSTDVTRPLRDISEEQAASEVLNFWLENQSASSLEVAVALRLHPDVALRACERVTGEVRMTPSCEQQQYAHAVASDKPEPRALTDRHLVRVGEAAAYIGLSASTLNKMRIRGEGPPWVRVGARAIAYRVSDLDQWIASKDTFNSTSEYEGT